MDQVREIQEQRFQIPPVYSQIDQVSEVQQKSFQTSSGNSQMDQVCEQLNNLNVDFAKKVWSERANRSEKDQASSGEWNEWVSE